MICIATPGLFHTSETFITRHIRELAPGRTVVVCFDGSRAEKAACAVHRVPRKARSLYPWFVRKPIALFTLAVRGHPDALGRRDSENLFGFLRQHEVTAVLAEYGPTACIVRDACIRAGANLFVHFHGNDASAGIRTWHSRLAYRRLAKDVTGIICPSGFLRDNLVRIGFPKQLIHVIPCGVDTEVFCPSGNDRDGNLVVAVGRFVEKKAPHHTLEAFALAVRRHPGLRLEMVGEGALLQQCRQLAAEEGLEAHVRFHGAREHSFVLSLMQRACIFCQHSVTAPNGDAEGLPVAILEAMSCGLPVVSTRHSGIPEAVADGRTGLLVEEHDVEGMAECICRLAADPDLRVKMGAAARERAVEHFSAARQLQRLRDVMEISEESEENV